MVLVSVLCSIALATTHLWGVWSVWGEEEVMQVVQVQVKVKGQEEVSDKWKEVFESKQEGLEAKQD